MALIYYHDRMEPQCIAAARRWLFEHTQLDEEQRRAMASLAPGLAGRLADDSPALVGIAGPPGSGKSTLALMMRAVLTDRGQECLVLSLDDYYLPGADRSELARMVHPLFAVRGVPGTHDFDLLLAHLDALQQGGGATLDLPRFDKSRDDRAKEWVRQQVPANPGIVFVEGWMIGLPPQPAHSLANPVNELEQERDADGRWRTAVNGHLGRYHEKLRPLLDQSWCLLAPDWDCVVDWRWRQAQQSRRGHSRLDTREAVGDFLAHYQRLSQHLQLSAGVWSDLIIRLDREHRPHLEPEE